jgi:hypothetical protein
MDQRMRLRHAMAKHLGKVMTPEIASAIETEAFAGDELAIIAPEVGALMGRSVSREQVEHLEAALQNLPQADCPVRHLFAPGIYAREMTIPAGVALTGAVHKTEHLSIVSKGRIAVTTDDGVKVLCAGEAFVSKPGAKRAGFALEETVWTTIHPTDETDIDKLVELLTESTNAELLGGSDNRQLSVSSAPAQIQGDPL